MRFLLFAETPSLYGAPRYGAPRHRENHDKVLESVDNKNPSQSEPLLFSFSNSLFHTGADEVLP